MGETGVREPGPEQGLAKLCNRCSRTRVWLRGLLWAPGRSPWVPSSRWERSLRITCKTGLEKLAVVNLATGKG